MMPAKSDCVFLGLIQTFTEKALVASKLNAEPLATLMKLLIPLKSYALLGFPKRSVVSVAPLTVP
jgi:hypothetical protein